MCDICLILLIVNFVSLVWVIIIFEYNKIFFFKVVCNEDF